MQFLQCSNALLTTGASFYAGNILLSKVKTGFGGNSYTGLVEHLTYDQGTQITGGTGSSSLGLVNSLLTGVTNNGVVTPTFNYSYKLATNTGVYLAVGGGGYYLANSSTNRDVGTTNINASLLAQLGRKTTMPPIAYTNVTFNTPTVLSPQAQRDTNTPDLGYHYDPLDYLYGGCHVNSNLTVTAGTAVGWFRYNTGWYHAGQGLHIADTINLTLAGTVNAPRWYAHQTMVQENLVGYDSYAAGPGGISGWALSQSLQPTLDLAFTKFSIAAPRNHIRDDYGSLRVNARHCEFYGGALGGYISDYALTNCLFYRANFWLEGGNTGYNTFNHLRNCTMLGGALSINRWDGGNPGAVQVTILDTVFDDTVISPVTDAHSYNSALTTYNYNGFRTNANRTTPTGANDVIVTNFNWQSGPLGNYYLPTNSPLINTGSVTAATVSLYHFTIQTNQVKEATSQVDIGYHYVGLDADGLPPDLDGNAVPDYLEDTNNNGIPDGLELAMGYDPSNANGLGNLTVPGHSIWLAAPKPLTLVP